MTLEQRLERLERKSRWMWWLCFGPVALALAAAALAHTLSVSKHLAIQKTKNEELALKVDAMTTEGLYLLLQQLSQRVHKIETEELALIGGSFDKLALKVQDLKDDQLVDEGLFAQLMGKIEKMESEEMWRKVQALSSINQELSRKIAQMRAEKPSAKDRDGKVRAELCTRPSGRSGLRLTDKNGTVRGFLGTEADGSPFLTLSDAKGKVIWKAPKD
ncbi:MAG: hypothetical protein ACYTDU_17740 [Planctomycetota bacterium]|jgi:hypothetical protein